MGTITLPNFRVSGTDRARVRLKDGGVYVEWSTMTDIKAWLYSVEQKTISGRFDVQVDPQDGTRLVCVYSAQKPQYLGVNKIILQCKYEGAEKTYDKPLWNYVRWTDDQAGEQITIDDPEVDVEIEVQDVTSSILDEAVQAALSAAERADEAAAAAEHMVDIHTGPQGKSAYEVAVEEGFTGTEEEWLLSLQGKSAYEIAVELGYEGTEEQWIASLKGPVGETPDISIGTVTTVEPGTPAAASMSGTPEAPVLNLSIPKGLVGVTPNITVGTVTTGEPGTPVVVTITGTAEAPVLNVTIPQGLKGDTGVSADYPITIHNGLDSNATNEALAAFQGKVLDGKISQLEAEVTDLDKNDRGVLSGVYGYKDISSLSTGVSITDVYYFAQKPKDGIVTGVRYKAKTGITRFSVVRVSQPGGAFALATVVADFTNDAADDGQIVYKDLHIQLAENEYLGIRDNFYFGPASGETQYTNNSTIQNYAPAFNILSHGVNVNADDVLEMEKTLYGDVEITNILEGGNINGSGSVTQDTPSRNLYIVYCKYRKIRVSTGDLYGFYALPPRLYSVSIDNARHVETLDDTVITIPDGAYYLAVRSATQPTFHSENDSLVERMDTLETKVDTLETMAKGYDVRLVASDIAMFENIGFCGDSYMAGMIVVSENPTVTAQNTNLCWGKILERTHGVNSFIYALGGVSVVNNKQTNAWYLDDANCLPKLLSESAKNLYVISLGHNDAYISTYTSKTKSEFLTEFDTNFRSIISQIASHAPNAKIILCKQSGPYSRMGWGADINAKIAEIGTALNLPVLDPANDEYLSSSVYENTMVHSHPTFAGYAGIAKAFDRQFSWATVQYFDYFKAYTGLS